MMLRSQDSAVVMFRSQDTVVVMLRSQDSVVVVLVVLVVVQLYNYSISSTGYCSD